MPAALLEFDSIARLVRRARKGDADAFRKLLEIHRPAVTSTLFACGVRSPDTANDLAQDVAMTCWTRLATLKDPKSFPAWIRRIAGNAARDHLRRLAVRREEDLEAASDVASDDDPHLDVERSAEMRLMIEALGTEDRELVDLFVARAEGMTIEALAERSGSSEGALKMRLTRARKRIRRRLDELRQG